MGTQTKRIQYLYDARGHRQALIDHDGGRFTYAYDGVGRISVVQNAQGERTSYAYDPAGRRTVKLLANGTRASFAYDPAGNLTKLYNLKSDGTVISSFDYSYDKVGNRTAVLEADGSRVTWSYDATYQLTGEHRTGTGPYRDTYTYDPTGNRLLKIHDGARTTSAYDAANQLTYSQDASGRTTYTFDADGNQQRILAPNGDRTTYVWDYENRMTSVRLPSGLRNTMAYEPEGLRVKLEESTGLKKFVWDEQNYLAETDSANDTQVVYTNEPRRYGNLVSQRRLTSGVWTPHWYHFDAIGSTRELTTAGQVVSDTRLYDAWGVLLDSTGAVAARFAYIGEPQYYDDSDSLDVYVRGRVYSPRTSEWRSRDPLAASHIAAYLYSGNNPTTLLDPSGLQEQAQERPEVTACCGTEVLWHLTAGMSKLKSAFDALSDEQKFRTCTSMWNYQNGWDINAFWLAGGGNLATTGKSRTITSTAGYTNVFTNGRCGSGECAGTVTIGLECYWAAEANYYLWGFANKFCNDWLLQKCKNFTVGKVSSRTVPRTFWRCPGGLETDREFSRADATGAVRLYRFVKYFPRYFSDPNPKYRRGGDAGIECRVTFTEAGWEGVPGRAAKCWISSDCAPCKNVYSGDPLLIYIGVGPADGDDEGHRLSVEVGDADAMAASGGVWDSAKKLPLGCCKFWGTP